jgi:glycosyltransferase involved in cell wall biosynthesis
MAAPDVTICIPAWQAESFIDRTLGCARAQTHAAVRVRVSIDAGEDRTEEICREHARQDARVEIIAQPQRLGWSRNANFLLDRVDTEYFFLYFHDDLIVPEYTARLLDTLAARPDAASVHCDMGHFGGSGHVAPGLDYEGSPAQRLATYFVAPSPGAPLRSLTRTAALVGRRLPTDAVGGLWANQPYLMRLLVAGPALRVPETLYLRWDKRAGGLTDTWRRLSLDEIYLGYRKNVETALGIVTEAAASRGEREALLFCLQLHTMAGVRVHERERGVSSFRRAEDIHPALTAGVVPPGLSAWGRRVETWALEKMERLRRLDACKAQEPSRGP